MFTKREVVRYLMDCYKERYWDKPLLVRYAEYKKFYYALNKNAT